MADYPTPPKPPKPRLPRPAGPTPVVERAIAALQKSMPEVYPFLENADLDTDDWAKVPSTEPDGFAGWRIRGSTIPPGGSLSSPEAKEGKPSLIRVNPLLVALGSDADVTRTLAHEATHAHQFGTLNPLEYLLRSAAPYEEQQTEEEARKVGDYVMEPMSRYRPSSFDALQSLRNFFNYMEQ